MILHRIASRNFRNLTSATVEFHPGVNLIVGDNGQGKTNLLESIYFLSTTKSFRATRSQILVNRGETKIFVEGTASFEPDLQRTLSVGLAVGEERKRELLVNRQKISLNDYLAVLPLFAYSASRLEIVRGGPEERRRFLDRGISSIAPAHLKDLTRYQRVLRQRNALLHEIRRGGARKNQLDAWDVELLSSAAPVVCARRNYSTLLNATLNQLLRELGYHLNDVVLTYEPSRLHFDSVYDDVSALQGLRPRELHLGVTLAGPHRDNLRIEVDGSPASDLLSGGEMKMLVLLLKYAKIRIFLERGIEPPLFLLDDIDAELDFGILEKLLKYLVGTVQIFTTSAKAVFFESLTLGAHRRLTMQGGSVVASSDFSP